MSSSVSCIVCLAPKAAPCSLCQDPVCAEHTAGEHVLARQLFGPFLFPARHGDRRQQAGHRERGEERICALCYRQRMWLAWRGLLGVLAAAAVLVALVEGQYVLIPIAAVVTAVWWGVSRGPVRRAEAQRQLRRRG